jgi:hypothetical protein
VGVTGTAVPLVTVILPGVITPVPPVKTPVRFVDEPAVIVEELAVKLVIVGAAKLSVVFPQPVRPANDRLKANA